MNNLLVMLPLVVGLPTLDRGRQADDDGERRIELSSTKFEKDAYLLGVGFGERADGLRIPRKAYAAVVDERKLLFFDLDRNRKLTVEDGFTFEGHSFIVPLPEELLLSRGQFSYRFEGVRAVVLRRSELDLDREVFPTAIAMTDVRVRAGLKPLVVDKEASRAARMHLDYLEANRIVRNRKITLEAHREHPNRSGYSAEGARAGATGILGVGRSLTEDVMCWYASTFHGVRLLDPGLEAVGVARRHGLSLVFPSSVDEDALQAIGGLQLHPPDGAQGVPPSFARGGEVPSPVPGRSLGQGAGFPIFVRLLPSDFNRKVSLEVRDAEGKLVAGHLSTPTTPASSVFPRNMGCVFFIPATRLENGAPYSVAFELEGMRQPLTWSFRTWEWEPKSK